MLLPIEYFTENVSITFYFSFRKIVMQVEFDSLPLNYFRIILICDKPKYLLPELWYSEVSIGAKDFSKSSLIL